MPDGLPWNPRAISQASANHFTLDSREDVVERVFSSSLARNTPSVLRKKYPADPARM